MSLKMLKTIWLALVGLAFLVSCTQQTESEVQPVLLQGKTMGTTFSVKLFPTQDDINQLNLYESVNNELIRINQLMSTYIADSELSKFNQTEAGKPFEFSADNVEILTKSFEINRESNGAFDVTVGPIVNLWGFGPNGRIETRPSDADIANVKHFVGIDKVSLTGNVAVKKHKDVYVDFSSIAKGFAVDKIAEYLERNNITNYLVEIGGEMRLSGHKPSGELWTVAVEKPVTNRREAQLIFSPGNIGMATSGDYRNYFEENGTRFSHTINPETAAPITHKLASVTVLHSSAASADAYATAINVLGPVSGVEFAEKNGIAAYFLIKTDNGFAEVLSTEFKKLIGKG
ncbi:FAD:protein FMN transferase [Psychrosphaera sp. B3R10]|nr:FAD:protein FMN transferase [Psychrosphaera sp. I2R16]MBU2989439.1 FAD:protein FMN transferase [Psychrosphaera sp. B3R10]